MLFCAGAWLALFDKILDYLEVPHSISVGAQPQWTCQLPLPVMFEVCHMRGCCCCIQMPL